MQTRPGSGVFYGHGAVICAIIHGSDMSRSRGSEDSRKLKKEKEVKRMNLLYKSTRSADKTLTASEAIL